MVVSAAGCVLVLAGLIGIAPVRALRLSAAARTVEAGPHAARTNLREIVVTISHRGPTVLGRVIVTVRDPRGNRTIHVGRAREILSFPAGATIHLTERPTHPDGWLFHAWHVNGNGIFHNAVLPQIRISFRIRSAVSVQAEYVAVTAAPTSSPPPVPTTTPTPIPTATPTVTPTPVSQVSPICRSWHPKPRCIFPTATVP